MKIGRFPTAPNSVGIGLPAISYETVIWIPNKVNFLAESDARCHFTQKNNRHYAHEA